MNFIDTFTNMDDILREILATLRNEPTQEISQPDYKLVYFSYPFDGSATTATLTKGTTTLNYEAGTIKAAGGAVTNMRHSLHSEGGGWIRSISLKADKVVFIQLNSGDKIPIQAGVNFNENNQKFKNLKIICSEDTKVFVICSTSSEIQTSNQIIPGVLDTISTHYHATAASSSETMESTAVPTGKFWHITILTGWNNSGLTPHIYLYKKLVNGDYIRFGYLNDIQKRIPLEWNGNLWLKEDEKIVFRFSSISIGNDLWFSIHGTEINKI